ncbi:hypothetical protein ACQ86C_07900 [Enterobacter asburiae]
MTTAENAIDIAPGHRLLQSGQRHQQLFPWAAQKIIAQPDQKYEAKYSREK